MQVHSTNGVYSAALYHPALTRKSKPHTSRQRQRQRHPDERQRPDWSRLTLSPNLLMKSKLKLNPAVFPAFNVWCNAWCNAQDFEVGDALGVWIASVFAMHRAIDDELNVQYDTTKSALNAHAAAETPPSPPCPPLPRQAPPSRSPQTAILTPTRSPPKATTHRNRALAEEETMVSSNRSPPPLPLPLALVNASSKRLSLPASLHTMDPSYDHNRSSSYEHAGGSGMGMGNGGLGNALYPGAADGDVSSTADGESRRGSYDSYAGEGYDTYVAGVSGGGALGHPDSYATSFESHSNGHSTDVLVSTGNASYAPSTGNASYASDWHSTDGVNASYAQLRDEDGGHAGGNGNGNRNANMTMNDASPEEYKALFEKTIPLEAGGHEAQINPQLHGLGVGMGLVFKETFNICLRRRSGITMAITVSAINFGCWIHIVASAS
ncbi:hypothetical protein C8R43DRAFT_953450 [Mycena crocata]|nr:hypothetical protein C8R43DRAFT_953450 [Mycena crocata]